MREVPVSSIMLPERYNWILPFTGIALAGRERAA